MSLYRSLYSALIAGMFLNLAYAADIIHDAEYYILETQNGERWAAEDADLDHRGACHPSGRLHRP